MSQTQVPEVIAYFDEATSTISYIVADRASGRAAVVDPVCDYDPKSGRTARHSADALIARVRKEGLTVEWILETHAHADHLTAAPYLKRELGGQVAIGAQIVAVQATFKGLFNLEPEFATDGSQFDRLFADGDRFRIGSLEARVLHTPGHTPACIAYIVGDAAFVGDTLFMPDYGTARCDFPGGDAATLYRSIRKLFALPPSTRLFMCHDYPPAGRGPAWETTVAAERAHNIHVHEGISEAAFVKQRTERDKTLDMPVLLFPSVQVNIRAGALPPAESNGVSYLKIPLNAI